MKVLGLIVITVLFAVLFAWGSFAQVQVSNGPDWCYAELVCQDADAGESGNNSVVSCMVDGPACDASVVDGGVICTGNMENGAWGTVRQDCQ